MIEEIYKSANESIDTKDAFERVSRNIFEKKYVNRRKVYCGIVSAAACAAAVCAVFLNMPLNVNDNTGIELAKKSEHDKPAVQTLIPDDETIKPDAETAVTEQAEVPLETKEKPKNVTQKTSETVKKEEVPVEQPKEPENNSDVIPIQVMMHINKAVMKNTAMRASVYSAEEDSAYAGGGAGVSVDISEETAVESEKTYEEISYEEYCGYIGCDIRSKIDGFAETSTGFYGIYKDGDGNITPESHMFSFEKDDEYMYITLTKDLSEVKEFLDFDEYEKSVFGENNVVVTQEYDIYNAYFTKDDTAYTVSLINSSEEELKNVILSLIQ